MTQPQTVAELQRLVVAGLGHVLKAFDRGHTRKAARLATDLRVALGGTSEAAVMPERSTGRPRNGLDWKSLLAAAAQSDRSVMALAAEHGVTVQTVYGAAKRHGVKLRFSDPKAPAPQPKERTCNLPPPWADALEKRPVDLPEPPPPAAGKITVSPRAAAAEFVPSKVMDGWKKNRVRTFLSGGRKLEEIAKLTSLPLPVVEAEAVAWRAGQ
jgi:hypothetical protein